MRWLSLLVLIGWAGGFLVALVIIKLLIKLLLSVPLMGWPPFGHPHAATPPAFLDIVKIGLSVVAGMGGIVALVVAYRRQRHLERDDAGYREEQKAFRDRYASAAEQLGDDHAAVRLAGIYAMANLADDWRNQRQQCVDVLCAYLRLPWSDDEPGTAGSTSTTIEDTYANPTDDVGKSVSSDTRRVTHTYSGRQGEHEVRRTLIAVIARHLQTGAVDSWSDLDFNFTGAYLVDANFVQATFSGEITSFNRATFSGVATSFRGATFSGRTVSFEGATFSGAATSFRGATFSGQTASFDWATFSGVGVSFEGASFFGATALFRWVTFSCNTTSFDRTTFRGKTTWFDGATFSGETVSFRRASFVSEAVSSQGVTFSGRTVSFEEAKFSGETAPFQAATFSNKPT